MSFSVIDFRITVCSLIVQLHGSHSITRSSSCFLLCCDTSFFSDPFIMIGRFLFLNGELVSLAGIPMPVGLMFSKRVGDEGLIACLHLERLMRL